MSSDEQRVSDVHETLVEIVREALDLPRGRSVENASQRTEANWDSLGHAMLVAAIESEFNLTIDAADSLELTSFQAIEAYLKARVE